MSDVDSQPASVTAEAEFLQSVLERNRRTFAWKTLGLDQEGLRATTAASAMTLGGLVKHVALVEADWLAVKLAGREYGPPRGTKWISTPILTGNGAPVPWTLQRMSTHFGETRSSGRARSSPT